jgi:hypothetical protein
MKNEKIFSYRLPLAMQKKTRVNPFYSRLFRSYIAVTKPFNMCPCASKTFFAFFSTSQAE